MWLTQIAVQQIQQIFGEVSFNTVTLIYGEIVNRIMLTIFLLYSIMNILSHSIKQRNI